MMVVSKDTVGVGVLDHFRGCLVNFNSLNPLESHPRPDSLKSLQWTRNPEGQAYINLDVYLNLETMTVSSICIDPYPKA